MIVILAGKSVKGNVTINVEDSTKKSFEETGEKSPLSPLV